MLVLGVDPGLANLGYGLVQKQSASLKVLDFGTVQTQPSTPQPLRLLEIHEVIVDLFSRYDPDVVVLEELFFGKNSATALLVGQALGVVQLIAAQHSIEVALYTPLQIKLSVVGYGRASKNQIQQMVSTLLGMSTVPQPDHAADALAVAICHIHSSKMRSFLKD